MSSRIIIKNILLLSIITLIIRSFGLITINFSNYIYNPIIFKYTNYLYILFYIVLIIGWKPTRFYHIIKIIYKLFGVASKYITEEDNLLLYVQAFDSVILSILGIIIINTQKLTANVMKTLAVITGLRFICKFFWGYKKIRNVILSGVSLIEQEKNIKANDLILKKIADADYDVLYKSIDNLSNTYKTYTSLKTDEERKNFIMLKVLELESNEKLDSNKSKYIKDLSSKIDELNKLKQSSQKLLTCMKTNVPSLENALNKID